MCSEDVGHVLAAPRGGFGRIRTVLLEHRAQVRVRPDHRRVGQLSVPERPRDRVSSSGRHRRLRPGGPQPEVRTSERAAKNHHCHGPEFDQVRACPGTAFRVWVGDDGQRSPIGFGFTQ